MAGHSSGNREGGTRELSMSFPAFKFRSGLAWYLPDTAAVLVSDFA